MAMTLAKSKSRKVQVGDLRRACTASLSFENDMKAAHADTPPTEPPAKLTAIRRSRRPKTKAAASGTIE